MKPITAFMFLSLAICCDSTTFADTFGSDGNTFVIEFVMIGAPGNAADAIGNPIPPHPTGSVAETYRISKFEISEDMTDKANALGGLSITHDGRGANKPATSISWFEAAEFVNWLNTSTGSTPAYKFDAGGNFQLWESGDEGYNASNLYRNSLAKYFLPSVDEWYKAAYYDPASSSYFVYPTGSNDVPDGIGFAGDTTFDAVFFDGGFNPQPNDITDVGVLSPYGTAGQGGNVWEWEETDFDLVNDSSPSVHGRGARGGLWYSNSVNLTASNRFGVTPESEVDTVGFRVASIRELSTLLGDMNGDGETNDLDINPFVQALTDRMAYDLNDYPTDFDSVGDINGDGSFNLGDIGAFKLLVAGTSASAISNSVPEPTTFGLAALSVLAFVVPLRVRAFPSN